MITFSNNQNGRLINSTHHVANKVPLTDRRGRLPLKIAITQTLSLSCAAAKYSTNAFSLSLVFVLVPNLVTNAANNFI
jgi:hypothetical protein